MKITTRLVIAIKWLGIVLGSLAYIVTFFVFDEEAIKLVVSPNPIKIL